MHVRLCVHACMCVFVASQPRAAFLVLAVLAVLLVVLAVRAVLLVVLAVLAVRAMRDPRPRQIVPAVAASQAVIWVSGLFTGFHQWRRDQDIALVINALSYGGWVGFRQSTKLPNYMVFMSSHACSDTNRH